MKGLHNIDISYRGLFDDNRTYNMQSKEKYPLISAITVLNEIDTYAVNRIVKCFEQQTYPNKELIIVNNNKTQFENSRLIVPARPDIFIVDTPAYVSSGMAKNYGISVSNGKLLAQFDINSHHHPLRLATQVAAIAQNDVHGTLLSHTLLYSNLSRSVRTYSNVKQLCLDTLVCIRPKDIDYPDSDKMEDKVFAERLVADNFKLISINQPELICKLILSNNGINEVNSDLPIEVTKYVQNIIM